MTPNLNVPLPRTTVFVTHAAPEDNEFALWISSKLALSGYRVWVDRRRLRGGDDFWDEIDRGRPAEQTVLITGNLDGQPLRDYLVSHFRLSSDDADFEISAARHEVQL